LNQYIIKRFNYHAKTELDNKIAEIQEYVVDKPFLPYVWSNTLFPGNIGQTYTQRSRISLTQEEEALREPNNAPLFIGSPKTAGYNWRLQSKLTLSVTHHCSSEFKFLIKIMTVTEIAT
jgi:hypothetical protein